MTDSRRALVWLLEVVLLFALISLLLRHALTPRKPTYTLVDLEIPALSNRTAARSNGRKSAAANVSLELEIQNPNKKIGIYYEATNVTLFYVDVSLGPIVIAPFYQKNRGEIRREKQSVKAEKRFWRAVSRAVSNGSTADLRVWVTTFVRYRTLGVKGKRGKMESMGWVPVASDGKRIKLVRGPLRNESKSRYVIAHDGPESPPVPG
ncbi:hypothetical protein H6P81_007071 [Aristolochia fimbriata]|uniref:Late embryogenesis abundant protein LEA-2 subgroup domain-containing protein n=1 Tax=Aristolochia fimbriata TaxID=158543 RepID=A0AAV7F2J1_ARIFI|nr:hypothetical protein H6P81_007071 [Aristolochia fimbriata]